MLKFAASLDINKRHQGTHAKMTVYFLGGDGGSKSLDPGSEPDDHVV